MDKSRGEQTRKLRLACSSRKFDRAIKLLKNTSKPVIKKCFSDALDHFDCNLDLVKAFVAYGADVNVKWKPGGIYTGVFITPLFISIRNANVPVVEYLISVGADVRYCNPDVPAFPMMFALWTFSYGDERPARDIIKVLIRSGADVNEEGGDALLSMVSCLQCSEETWRELFELFIQHGANFKLQRPFLYRACKVKNIVAIKYILNSGMKPSEEIRCDGHTALHIATGYCKLSPTRNQWWKKPESDVELLLEWGANVDDQVIATGYTALHYACVDVDIIKLASLLDYGANVHLVNSSTSSALFKLLNALCKDKQLKDYLISSSEDDEAKPDENSANQRLEQYAKMVKLLVASGAHLIDNEWLIEYNAPCVVLATVGIVRCDSSFARRIHDLIYDLKDTLRSPRSLADLCRSEIRSCVTGKKSVQLDQLSPLIPSVLVDYLVYRDIFPEHKYW